MSKVIQFPNKQIEEDGKPRTPEEALRYVLGMIESGATEAEQMVITWSCQEEGTLHLRYIVAGESDLTGAVGLLEITKGNLIE